MIENGGGLDAMLVELNKHQGYKVPDRRDAIPQGVCIKCGLPAAPRCTTHAGRHEYQISGLDEICYDEIMKEPPDAEIDA